MKHKVRILAEITHISYDVEVEAATPEEAVEEARRDAKGGYHADELHTAASDGDTEITDVFVVTPEE